MGVPGTKGGKWEQGLMITAEVEQIIVALDPGTVLTIHCTTILCPLFYTVLTIHEMSIRPSSLPAPYALLSPSPVCGNHHRVCPDCRRPTASGQVALRGGEGCV
jgi:hypothetical protein